MSEPDFNALAAARNLSKLDEYDRARDVVLIGTSAIPVVGSPLAQWLSGYLPDWRMARLKEFLESLAADFEHLKDRVDKQKADSPEFVLGYLDTLKRMEFETSEHKRRAFRATLVNACLPCAPELAVQAVFRAWLADMTEVQVVVASRLRCKEEHIPALVDWLKAIPDDLLADQVQSLKHIRLDADGRLQDILPDILDASIDFTDEKRKYGHLVDNRTSKAFLHFITLDTP